MSQVPPNDTIDRLTECDREPIHVPGSIQPHGIMLIARADDQTVVAGAGDIAAEFGDRWMGSKLANLLHQVVELSAEPQARTTLLRTVHGRANLLNALAFASDDHIVIELEPKLPEDDIDLSFVRQLSTAAGVFERSAGLTDLSAAAAHRFREMTGYARVMIYKFLDDDSGVVVAESAEEGIASFMNHHFPASDIPKQARALYVRNRVRVIADVDYQPQPIHPAAAGLGQLDLSDSTLRSVSPIHIQYLKNMGVGASASISIIQDGFLWGLIACHNPVPKRISRSTQIACEALAGGLARQIKSKVDADLYRERIRLRSQEDVVINRLGSDRSVTAFFEHSGQELAKLVGADAFAAIQGNEMFVYGNAPDKSDIREIAKRIKVQAAVQPFSSHELGRQFNDAVAYSDRASGLLAVTMSTEVPTILLWFRAEHLEVVQWAGNPHKGTSSDGSTLTPRTSFDAWSEQVRGKAKPWTLGEIEAATRIVRLMLEHRNNHRMRELNAELATTLKENQTLIKQKDYLLKEVNHRVQNSLQLVSAFLRLQSRSIDDVASRSHLEEAQKRLNAVALVHRRLHQDESVEVIDLSRYLEDLCTELRSSMDAGWSNQIEINLAPILVATDRAVNIGLILTELIINANKYAYDGRPGPLTIELEQHRTSFRLIVADRGSGKVSSDKGAGSGFGSRMLTAIVERLAGHIDEEDNRPGLRTIVTAPIDMAILISLETAAQYKQRTASTITTTSQ